MARHKFHHNRDIFIFLTGRRQLNLQESSSLNRRPADFEKVVSIDYQLPKSTDSVNNTYKFQFPVD